MKAGELLASNPHAAVVLVSDMKVDRPPEDSGEVVCGQVKAAAGPGRVPAYFGQCLVESWTNVPAWTTLTGLLVHAAEPKLRAPLPLFVMVLSRNPAYAASLNQRLKDRLSGDSAGPLVAASLVLAAQQPSIPCDRLSKCAYRVRADTVALHKDERGSQPCSFRATAKDGTHALRCAVQPMDSVQEGIIRVRRVKAESMEPKRLRVEQPQPGYVDLNCAMSSWSTGVVKAGVRFAYEWAVADDVDNQLSEWLGETWAANDDYRSTFRTAVSAMHAKFPPVRCAEEWFIPYTK
jgi:hypothetical protein